MIGGDGERRVFCVFFVFLTFLKVGNFCFERINRSPWWFLSAYWKRVIFGAGVERSEREVRRDFEVDREFFWMGRGLE